MWKPQVDVAYFMQEVKGLDVPSKLTKPTIDQRNLCIALMVEELSELEDAMQQQSYHDSIVEIADGLADLLYVTLYTANVYGIDIEPIFDEVQRSNMTKIGGGKSPSGKQQKGPNYEPPDLAPILQKML